MKTTPFIFWCLLFCQVACNQSAPAGTQAPVQTVTDLPDTTAVLSDAEILASIQHAHDSLQPIFGHRFVIRGDFNGDGKQEQLMEHFVSLLEKKETDKYYRGMKDYGDLVEFTMHKWPASYASASQPGIDTLHIAEGGQLLGLSFLKNEGDLDGDGGDEVSYVVCWADFSSLNTCHIVSYKNQEWRKIYSFSIYEWQLPELPSTFLQHALYGSPISAIPPGDAENQEYVKEMTRFKGLIKKTGPHKIEVKYGNEAEEMTRVVDLKNIKPDEE